MDHRDIPGDAPDEVKRILLRYLALTEPIRIQAECLGIGYKHLKAAAMEIRELAIDALKILPEEAVKHLYDPIIERYDILANDLLEGAFEKARERDELWGKANIEFAEFGFKWQKEDPPGDWPELIE